MVKAQTVPVNIWSQYSRDTILTVAKGTGLQEQRIFDMLIQ